MRALHRAPLLLALAALTACHDTPFPTSPRVSFYFDAPLCGLRLPVLFWIDSVLVGVDTFGVNVNNPHLTSVSFETNTGHHILGARSVGGYIWPDKAVNLLAGQSYLDSLPFYCS